MKTPTSKTQKKQVKKQFFSLKNDEMLPPKSKKSATTSTKKVVKTTSVAKISPQKSKKTTPPTKKAVKTEKNNEILNKKSKKSTTSIKKNPKIPEISPKEENILKIKNLSVWIAQNHIVRDISIAIPKNKVIAVMGPSGCGKSSLLRAINRMHDLNEKTRVSGKIILDEKADILQMEATQVRKKIGMVFQKPNPFPNMSIYENVVAGYTLIGQKLKKEKKDQLVRENLVKAALWKEVKDRLHARATTLSGGQQQRLCIARSLAMVVDVLLLDEPTSALDPIATAKIENLIETLKSEVTIIIVTHNNAQASRISDYTGFMYMGKMIEYNQTKIMFTVPKEKMTEEYLSGKFS